MGSTGLFESPLGIEAPIRSKVWGSIHQFGRCACQPIGEDGAGMEEVPRTEPTGWGMPRMLRGGPRVLQPRRTNRLSNGGFESVRARGGPRVSMLDRRAQPGAALPFNIIYVQTQMCL